MQSEKLKQIIEQTQKTMTENKEWEGEYEKLADTMLEHQELAMQFYRKCKHHAYLQFYLIPVTTIPPNVFIVKIKYDGQEIAKATITKDNEVHISTEEYEENNRKDFGCNIKLEHQEWESKASKEFLEYFREGISRKTKENEKGRIESLLMTEISKTCAIDKLILGIQPITFEKIPYIIETNTKEPITLLARTIIKKPAIIEVADPIKDNGSVEELLEKAVEKTVFLTRLLHSQSGEKWHQLMGYRTRVQPHMTIRLGIAIPKKWATKENEFQPFELRSGNDSIEVHFIIYNEDKGKITSIQTSLTK